MPDRRASRLIWFVLAIFVLAADQGTKLLASAALEYATPQPVFSWFSLTLHHNEGAAFSFLSDAGGWQRWFFAILAIGISGMLAVWLWTAQAAHWVMSMALSLVLGGALGNLVDRLRLGYVVDFVSVHYESWFFPTFNVADAAISLGATLIVLDSLFGRREERRESDEWRELK